MPSYSFKCAACDAERTLSMAITEAPGIGSHIMIKDDEDHCAECNGEVFERIWGQTSAPFRFNMRRTSL